LDFPHLHMWQVFIFFFIYIKPCHNKILRICSTGNQFQILLTNGHTQIGDATRFRGQTRDQRQRDITDNSIVAKAYPIQRCNKLPCICDKYLSALAQLQS
jgi:hypothetical protein